MFSKILSVFSILALSACLMVMAACSTSTVANLWQTAGQLADAYLSAYAPGWSDRAAFDAAWAKALTSIQNFPTGASKCSEVVTAVNDAISIFDTVPSVTPQQKLLLATISASINIVSSHFASCAPLGAARFHQSVMRAQLPAGQLPALSASDLKVQWKKNGGPMPASKLNPLNMFKKK